MDVLVHPLASVTVHVYCPGVNPFAVALFPPNGDQEYEYPGMPPLATTFALPFPTALQAAGVEEFASCIALGWLTVTEVVEVQE